MLVIYKESQGCLVGKNGPGIVASNLQSIARFAGGSCSKHTRFQWCRNFVEGRPYLLWSGWFSLPGMPGRIYVCLLEFSPFGNLAESEPDQVYFDTGLDS